MTTVLVWNIETYGAKFTGNTAVDTLCRMIRDRLIAVIIAQSGADVVIIQELRKNGIGRLPILQQLLALVTKANWKFDIVEGAVTLKNVTFPEFSDIEFTQSANNEGYAVLWRSDVVTLLPISYQNGGNTATYVQSYGTNSTNFEVEAPHVIALANQGYKFQWCANQGLLSANLNQAGDDPNAQFIGFPYSFMPDIVFDQAKDGNILSRINTRRPAVVSIASGDGSIPVVAYHAPVRNNSSIAGTIAALAAKELCYPVNGGDPGPNGPIRVFAGDLNLDTQSNHLSANGVAAIAGFQKTMIDADGNAPATMVKPLNFNNTAYNNADYLHTARDYAFGSETVQSVSVCQAVTLLYNNGLLSETLRQDTNVITLLTNQAYYAQLPLPALNLQGGAWPTVMATFLTTDYANLSQDDQTNICSVFYRFFVSDHLPVEIVLP